MKRLAALLAALSISAQVSTAADKESRVYELLQYTVAADKSGDFAPALRDYAKLFEKSGATPLGYFRALDPKAGKFVALLSYPDAAAAEKTHAAMKGAALPEKDQSKLAGLTGFEATMLTPTDYSPAVDLKKADTARVFELRIYTTTPGNLPALDSRFRDHTIALFKTHGMTNLWYFHKAAGQPGADNTLVYFLAHDSTKARDKSFDDFRQDSKWVTAMKASEAKAGGSLTAKDGVKSLLLTPTDYSPIR